MSVKAAQGKLGAMAVWRPSKGGESQVAIKHATKNMGAFDRAFRAFIVAPAIIVVAFVLGAGTVLGVILFVVAGIMLTTALAAFCPTYTVLGISTRPRGLHRVGHGLHAGHA
jgi:hypothetical protein